MAALPVVLVGTTQDGTPITITGLISIVGLGVGGGPVIPPTPPSWGPGGPPAPAHPIWGPPGIVFPPGPGYPPVVGGGPIIPPVVPPDPGTPPTLPNIEWKTAWSPETGWIVVGIPQDPHPTPSATA
jgi:hypothetical protein